MYTIYMSNEVQGLSFSPLDKDVITVLEVDPRRHDVEVVFSRHAVPRAEDASKSGKKARRGRKKAADPGVEEVWRKLQDGSIDMSYACVGYSYDGRPVLEYNLVVDLLVQYGFKGDDVYKFIDEFAELSTKDGSSPIVMTNANTARMMVEVEPLGRGDAHKAD